MDRLLGQHLRREQLHISVLVPRDQPILRRRWIILFGLPNAENIARLISEPLVLQLVVPPTLDHLVGRLERLDHPALFVPLFSGLQHKEAFPRVDGLAPDESQTWHIRRVEGFELEQMALQHVQRVVLAPGMKLHSIF